MLAERGEVAGFVVRGVRHPAVKDDALPFVREGTLGLVGRFAAVELLLVEGAPPSAGWGAQPCAPTIAVTRMVRFSGTSLLETTLSEGTARRRKRRSWRRRPIAKRWRWESRRAS